MTRDEELALINKAIADGKLRKISYADCDPNKPIYAWKHFKLSGSKRTRRHSKYTVSITDIAIEQEAIPRPLETELTETQIDTFL